MKTPPLCSWNRFEGLIVDDMNDSDNDMDTVAGNIVPITTSDSHSTKNGRGPDESQLGIPEMCLIPKPVESKLVTSPWTRWGGVKYRI